MRVKISLKVKIVFLVVFVLFLGGSAVFFVVDKQISSFVLENIKNSYSREINSRATEYFDLSWPASLKIIGKYTEFAKAIEGIAGVSRLKVLDSNGIVIYSANPIEVGQNFIDSSSIKSALIGESSLTDINKDEKTADIYSPIKSEANDVRGIVYARIALTDDYYFLGNISYELLYSIGGLSIVFLVIIYFIFANAEREITDQGRTVIDKSKALEEEQRLDEAIMSSIAESLIVINKDGQIMLFNPEAERIIGHKSVDVEYRLYKKIILFCDKDGKEVTKNPITEALNLGKKITINIKEGLYIKNAKNELIPVSVSVAPVTAKGETIRGVVATIQDVTAEKELDKVRDEFVYIVVHELGNPIFALDGYLSIMQEDNKKYDKQTRNIIDSARGINQQLSSLVNDLLEMVRSESGQLKIDVTPIDLTSITKAVVESASIKAKLKKITINYKAGKLPKVMGDEQKVREVVTNLIDNAIKYTLEGGKVDIWHEEENGVVTSFVKDSGMGMEKEAVKHLFEKFFRVKSDQTKGISGTGLGLFICRQIVEKCGGKIWAESKEGEGSTFAFSLKKTR